MTEFVSTKNCKQTNITYTHTETSHAILNRNRIVIIKRTVGDYKKKKEGYRKGKHNLLKDPGLWCNHLLTYLIKFLCNQ